MSRAVFVEDPILAAVAVDSEHERVRRAPAAGRFMEPADQRSAAAVITAHRKFSGCRKLVVQRPRRNDLREPGRRARPLNPAGDFTARAVRMPRVAPAKVLSRDGDRIWQEM